MMEAEAAGAAAAEAGIMVLLKASSSQEAEVWTSIIYNIIQGLELSSPHDYLETKSIIVGLAIATRRNRTHDTAEFAVLLQQLLPMLLPKSAVSQEKFRLL